MNNLLDIALEAVEFASIAHQGVNRYGPGGVPYLNHVIDVARRVHRHGFVDPPTIRAAILHDVVEDTKKTLLEIQERFGFETAELVNHLTLPKEAQNDWRKKKEFQAAKMKVMDARGQGIKVADKTSNNEDLLVNPPDWSPKAIRGYASGSRDLVLLADTSDPRVRGLVADFERVYERLERHYGWKT